MSKASLQSKLNSLVSKLAKSKDRQITTRVNYLFFTEATFRKYGWDEKVSGIIYDKYLELRTNNTVAASLRQVAPYGTSVRKISGSITLRTDITEGKDLQILIYEEGIILIGISYNKNVDILTKAANSIVSTLIKLLADNVIKDLLRDSGTEVQNNKDALGISKTHIDSNIKSYMSDKYSSTDVPFVLDYVRTPNNVVVSIENFANNPEIKEALTTAINKIAKKQALDVSDWKASPSLVDTIKARLCSVITGKPTPGKYTRTRKVQVSTEIVMPAPSFKVITRAIKLPPEPPISHYLDTSMSIATIIGKINASLHASIKAEMNDSNDPRSPEYLRYQTGEFARSAVVTNIINDTIYYDYKKDPYSIYTKGNIMYQPGRDVEGRYIEGSIRELATSLMKDKFNIKAR